MARYKGFSTTPMADYSKKLAKRRAKNSIFKTKKRRKKSGCYVATCVYGSYDCPQVRTLRRYRDMKLKESFLGRAFISMYYAVSPALVKRFGETAFFKQTIRKALDRMVIKLQRDGFGDAPYSD